MNNEVKDLCRSLGIHDETKIRTFELQLTRHINSKVDAMLDRVNAKAMKNIDAKLTDPNRGDAALHREIVARPIANRVKTFSQFRN